MKQLLALLALVACLVIPQLAQALNCPNKPSNAATLATVHFNTSDGEGQLWELYPGAGQIQSPAGAEGTASASILAPGQPTGGQQTIWPKPGNQQPLNNMYVCFRWKINSQFVGIVTNNKLIFSAAQDWTYGKQGFNAVLSVPRRGGYPPFPGSSLQMLWNHNSGNLDNSHACAADLGLICYPNLADTPILQDTWYEVELYTIASSSTTSRNGTVKWWINNVPQGSYTNLNVGDGIVNEFQINHTWDGSGAVQCYNATTNPLGRDCTNPQIHYFDELLIASVGGIPAGSGGGSAPPPLDTPAGPPGTVSGFTATVGGVQ